MPSQDYHQSVELEEAALSHLQSSARGLSRFSIVFVLSLGAVAILGMLYVLLLGSTSSVNNTAGTTEDEVMPARDPNVQLSVAIKPPPPPIPAVVQEPPQAPPPPPPIDDGGAERRRLAEEQARLEAERLARLAAEDAERWTHFRSPMIVVSQMTTPPPTPELAPTAGQAKKPEDTAKSPGTFQDGKGDYSNDKFLESVTDSSVQVAKADLNPRIDALVPQGTIIRGVLESGIISDLPGMVRATTTEDVWSFDGRRILVPSGSHLIGQYSSDVKQGQTRVFVVWTRLLRADGVSLDLGSIGGDELGRSGSAGDVDNHYLERYGPAVLLSVLSAATQVLTAAAGNQGNTSGSIIINSAGVASQIPSGAGGASIASSGAGAAGQAIVQLGQEMSKDSLSIRPTITIDQGTAVAIIVRRDLDFSELYPDPVQEKLQELKQKRGRYD